MNILDLIKILKKNSNYFKQLDIPENLLTDHQEYFFEVKREAVVLFDRALVHRSNNNPSIDYSFAILAGVWEHWHDLIISRSIVATVYGGDIGRSDFYISNLD